MKTGILLCFVVLFFAEHLSAQTPPFTVRALVGPVKAARDQDIPTHYPPLDTTLGEWQVPVWAQVFDANKSLVVAGGGVTITYEWQVDYCDGQGWRLYTPSPYGPDVGPDGNFQGGGYHDCFPSKPWAAFLFRCFVTVNGEDYLTNVVRVPDNFTGWLNARAPLYIDQQKESGATIGNVSLYETNGFYNYPANHELAIPVNSNQIFRGTQLLIDNEKYNRWSRGTVDIADVVNHKTLNMTTGYQRFTSKLKPIHNATIQTCVAEGGLVAGYVYFKDPWIPDDYSDPKGVRNRGNNGIFYSKSTPYYPLSDGAIKGVFKDQTVASGNYYTLKAFEPITGTNLVWSFSYWTVNGATVSNPTNVETPVVFNSTNATVTANYNTVVKPQPPSNVLVGGGWWNNVVVTWTMHPSVNVTQYQVWRFTNRQPTHVLLATVPRTTTSYTDPTYVITPGYSDEILYYDVRSYYAPNGTYSDPYWTGGVFGTDNGAQAALGTEGMIESRKPTEFAIGAFPNPFNPSTQLQYQLKEDSYVRIVIFDMLGRTVAELVNTAQRAGTHTRLWNASEMGSGIYFAMFIVTPVNEKPFAITKKLMLMK